MATILVGPEQKKFMVHQPLLCSKSQYFNKALTGSFEESKTGIVKLEDVSPVLFQIFVTWLYNGKIIYTTSNDNSNIDRDFASLGWTIRTPEMPTRVPEETSTWPNGVLAGLHILADRLDIKELRIASIDAFISCVHRQGGGFYAFECHYIYSNTTAGSPLRTFVLDELAYGVNHDMAEREFWEDLPHEMAISALLMMGQRMSTILCDPCYRNGIVHDNDHPCRNKDVAPFKVDLCLYHEHADDEEEKACRARRNTIVID